MRFLSMTLLTRGRPGGRGEGGLLRRVIAATPPRRRSALLLTIFSALFVYVLGFTGAGTALAQGPTLTGYCVSTDTERSITLQGTGWGVGPNVYKIEFDFYHNGAFFHGVQRYPDANGNITLRDDRPEYVPGESFNIEADQPDQGLSAKTTVTCPQAPGGGGGGGGEGPTTSPGGGGGGGGGGSGQEGSAAGSSGVIPPVGDVFSGLFAGQLPDTGGGWAILLIAGAILIALGWLLVRLARKLAAR
jgi:LPXTG-motif cell wall-anchored protein